MAEIIIKNLKISCIIGTKKEERENKQNIFLDITFSYDMTKAAETDNLEFAVDYESLKNKIVRFVENSSYLLVEKLIHEIKNFILKEENKIEKVNILLKKPNALSNDTDYIAIHI